VSAEPTPHLHLIDTDSGEVHERCPSCEALEDQLAGAEFNVRSMRGKMQAKQREVEEIKASLLATADPTHELFPKAVALFRYWQERTGHPRQEFTADRMALVLPFIRRHDDEEIRRAIRGAAFDPFVTTRKNGTEKHHNGWNLLFQSEDKFQSFVERAPEPRDPTDAERSLLETAAEVASRIQERARLFEAKEPDAVVAAHLLLEVDRLIAEWRQQPPTEEGA
jgi:hypothetical protein